MPHPHPHPHPIDGEIRLALQEIKNMLDGLQAQISTSDPQAVTNLPKGDHPAALHVDKGGEYLAFTDEDDPDVVWRLKVKGGQLLLDKMIPPVQG